MTDCSGQSRRDRILARGRSQIGVSFRPRGRRPDAALDCAGLAAYCLGGEAALQTIPVDYTLRGNHHNRVIFWLQRLGCLPVDRGAGRLPGDILLVNSAPGQLHLLICIDDGYLHADAVLGRIVFTPDVCRWPVIACWRHKDII